MTTPAHEFMECAACSAKPGTPTLCPSCLHNRYALSMTERDRRTLEHIHHIVERAARPTLGRMSNAALLGELESLFATVADSGYIVAGMLRRIAQRDSAFADIAQAAAAVTRSTT